jgi:hypothetical protein
MDDAELHPDLAALEGRLAGRPRPEPSTAFRSRLLAIVGRELKRGEVAPGDGAVWYWVAVAAAAALLWINFSMSVANDMDWHFWGGLERNRLEGTAARIRTLFPELGAREALRQALLLQACSRLVPVPDLQPSPDQIFRYKERVAWDMR